MINKKELFKKLDSLFPNVRWAPMDIIIFDLQGIGTFKIEEYQNYILSFSLCRDDHHYSWDELKHHFHDKLENPFFRLYFNKSNTIKISREWFGKEQIFYTEAGMTQKLIEFIIKFADELINYFVLIEKHKVR
jgi:hypothetical protein